MIEPELSGRALPVQYQLKKVPSFSSRFLAFNTRRPYLERREARRAISLIVGEIFKDHPGHFEGLFPPGLFYNAPPSPSVLRADDPLVQGQEMLRALGPPKAPLRLIYRSADVEAPAEAAQIAESLSSAGLQINYEGLDEAELRRTLESAGYDMFLDTRTPDIPSPDMWLGSFLDSSSSIDGNPAYFRNSRADRLIDDIVHAAGRLGEGPSDVVRLKKEQADKIAELGELAVLEAPYLFLYASERPLLIDVRLGNTLPHPQWPEVWPFDQVYLKPFSFRSGANPSGRPPEKKVGTAPRKQRESKNPSRPNLSTPTAPVKPLKPEAPKKVERSAPTAPSVTEPQPQPRLKFLEPQDFHPQAGPPNPNPDYDDFIGEEME